ncbi:MAG: pseudouridine synthase [Casimicrobiaceae bacterium]
MAQPNLALNAINESLPPAKHKRSTDEVFNEPQRLHKVLASCGFGSRRAMEEMIVAGRITVNRLPADVGQKVSPGDEVRINGELVKVRFTEPRPRVLMYHKPAGEIVTRDDPEGRPTVFTKLPNIGNGKWINVGRLDFNTEGLLLFTNSGELANRLMHPRYEVEREYAVRIMGRMSDEQSQMLVSGVQLEDGLAKCEKVEDGGGEEEGANHWYHVVLKEGRNREVRRLFEALNLSVSRLIRTRYGTLAMPSVMKRGDTLELEAPEVAAVMDAAGLKSGGAAPGGRPHGARPQGGPGQQQRRPGQGGQPRQGDGQRPGGAQGQRPHGKQGGRPHGKGANGQGGNPQGEHRQGDQRQGEHRGPRQGGQPRPQGPRPDFETTQPLSNANAIGLRPHHGKGGGQQRSRGYGANAQGGAPRQSGPRPDFETTQPHSNANAIGLRPHGQGARRSGGFGGPKQGGGGPRPNPNQPRTDFDEIQPLSNANRSPYVMTTLGVPGGAPRGPNEGGFANRGNRSGPRGSRPGGGQPGKGGGGGQFRGKGGAGPNRQRQGKPGGGEADGNVMPAGGDARPAPREVDGNIALPEAAKPRDDD